MICLCEPFDFSGRELTSTQEKLREVQQKRVVVIRPEADGGDHLALLELAKTGDFADPLKVFLRPVLIIQYLKSLLPWFSGLLSRILRPGK